MRSFTRVSVIGAAMFLPGAGLVHGQCPPQEVAQLLASNASAGDLFGFSVAFDGDTAIVGAMGHDTVPGPIARQGAAYIFVRAERGGAWMQQAILTASDGIAGDNFGSSVAIHGDMAVVGAYAPLGFRPGLAYVFGRSGSTWTERTRLTASDGALFDYFGVSTAIQNETVVIGASKADVAGRTDAGAAYVFERSGNHWNQRAKLAASDADHEDHFGASIAMDGETIVIGAPDDNSPGGQAGALRDSGSAYVFVRAGGQWIQQAILAAPQPRFIGAFGSAVALEGDTLLVGEPSPLGPGPGVAHVFERSGGAWAFRSQLDPSDGAPRDDFGGSIAFDGGTAVIGAARHDGSAGSDTGAAYVFDRAGGVWAERAKLTASGAGSGDHFGISVALDAGAVVVGAWSHDTSAGANAGAAYVFDVACAPCYANCDNSAIEPTLNVDDFTCFINEFAGAQVLPHEQQIEHYANCDGSAAAPVLNVDDFTCFIDAFAQGCP